MKSVRTVFVRSALVAVGLLAIGSRAGASSIAINNFSFETPGTTNGGTGGPSVAGWTFSNASASSGIYKPVSTQYPGGVPDGTQAAYIQEQTFTTITGGPTVTTNLLANTLYTLTVWVGARADDNDPIGNSTFSFSLLAGGTTLATKSKGDAGITAPSGGHFLKETLTFTTGASVASGQALGIVLGAQVNSGSEYDFDDVTLDASPTTAPVPLPSAWWMGLSMLGMGGLFRLLRGKVRAA